MGHEYFPRVQHRKHFGVNVAINPTFCFLLVLLPQRKQRKNYGWNHCQDFFFCLETLNQVLNQHKMSQPSVVQTHGRFPLGGGGTRFNFRPQDQRGWFKPIVEARHRDSCVDLPWIGLSFRGITFGQRWKQLPVKDLDVAQSLWCWP